MAFYWLSRWIKIYIQELYYNYSKIFFDTLQHDLSKDKVTGFCPENDVKSVIITLSQKTENFFLFLLIFNNDGIPQSGWLIYT